MKLEPMFSYKRSGLVIRDLANGLAGMLIYHVTFKFFGFDGVIGAGLFFLIVMAIHFALRRWALNPNEGV